jgi:hypothetical protein
VRRSGGHGFERGLQETRESECGLNSSGAEWAHSSGSSYAAVKCQVPIKNVSRNFGLTLYVFIFFVNIVMCLWLRDQ